MSFKAVGIWEVYAVPPRSLPATEPVEVIVAVATLFAVTSLTNPVYVKFRVGVRVEPGWSIKMSDSASPMGNIHIRQPCVAGVGAGSKGRSLRGPGGVGVARFALLTCRPWVGVLAGTPVENRQTVDSSSTLIGGHGTTGRLVDPAVTGPVRVDDGRADFLNAESPALDKGDPPVSPSDREELALWADLQICSFAPGRLVERDAKFSAARVWSNDVGDRTRGALADIPDYRFTTRSCA